MHHHCNTKRWNPAAQWLFFWISAQREAACQRQTRAFFSQSSLTPSVPPQGLHCGQLLQLYPPPAHFPKTLVPITHKESKCGKCRPFKVNSTNVDRWVNLSTCEWYGTSPFCFIMHSTSFGICNGIGLLPSIINAMQLNVVLLSMVKATQVDRD